MRQQQDGPMGGDLFDLDQGMRTAQSVTSVFALAAWIFLHRRIGARFYTVQAGLYAFFGSLALCYVESGAVAQEHGLPPEAVTAWVPVYAAAFVVMALTHQIEHRARLRRNERSFSWYIGDSLVGGCVAEMAILLIAGVVFRALALPFGALCWFAAFSIAFQHTQMNAVEELADQDTADALWLARQNQRRMRRIGGEDLS